MTGAPELKDGAWWFRQPDGSVLRWDDATQSWTPVGPEGGLQVAGVREPWLPIRKRAKVVRILLFVVAGVSLLALVSDGFQYEMLGRLADGKAVSDAEFDGNNLRQSIIGSTQDVLFLGVVVLFLMWFFRAYSNLQRLGARDLRKAPGWSIGAWFVPVYWWWGPKQIANDLWRASDPGLPAEPGGSWRGGPIPALLFGCWWGAFILSAINGNFIGGDDYDEQQLSTALWFVSDLLTLVAALLCATVVARTTSRQEARATQLGFRATG